jgi:hypothetical protein
MTQEFQLRVSLQCKKGNLTYQSQPTAFTADMVGVARGPSPGAVNVAVAGTDVTFTQLTRPALCRITNLDAVNYIEYGIRDASTNRWYPLGEVLPGEFYIIRLSRNLFREYPGTGTGSYAPADTLRLRANIAPCVALIEAFEA